MNTECKGALKVTGKRGRNRQIEATNSLSRHQFPIALAELSTGDSVRMIAERTGIGVHLIFDMLHGHRVPTPEHFEMIARAYAVSPEHFLEYRIDRILSTVKYSLYTEVENSINDLPPVPAPPPPLLVVPVMRTLTDRILALQSGLTHADE